SSKAHYSSAIIPPLQPTILWILIEMCARLELTCSLVRHRIDDIVDADADPERRESLRVSRQVGELPGIPDIRVEGDGHHQPSLVIAHAQPLRSDAAVARPAAQSPFAQSLIAVIQVVDGVEQSFFIAQLDDFTVRENLLHPGFKPAPLVG